MTTTVELPAASSRTASDRYGLWFLIVFAGLLASAALAYTTRWGIGTSPDSVAYIHEARALGEGGSLVKMGTQWPPLYPLLLAGTALISGDPFIGARWLHALLFSLNVALFGVLLLRLSPNRWSVIVGVLVLMSAAPMLTVHAYAWSEPIFLLLVMTGLTLLAKHLSQPGLAVLALAAILVGFACLTRYAGLPLVAVGAVLLLFRRAPGLKKRLAEAGLFTGVALALPIAWFTGTLVAGDSASRTFAFHPIGRAQLWQAIFTVSDWLHVPAATPGLARLLLVGLLYLAGSAALLWRRRQTVASPDWRAAFVRLLALFVLFYLGFLALTISFLDANTPLDDRILSPVYAAVLLLGMAGYARLVEIAGRQRLRRASIVAVLGLFLIVQLAGAASWIREQHRSGLGYSSPAWQQSPTLGAVRDLPASTVIFSNAPEAIDLLARRDALSLPRRNAAMLAEKNASYEEEIAALQRAVEVGAVLVYFDAVADRPVASASELEQRMSLAEFARLGDGTILVAGPVE